MKSFCSLALVLVLLCGLAVPALAAQAPAVEIIVKDMTNRWAYRSADGGVTWVNNAKPPVYISLESTAMPVGQLSVTYTVHNNTKEALGGGMTLIVMKWNGSAWNAVPSLPVENMTMTSDFLAPESSIQMKTAIDGGREPLEAGVYKLVKSFGADGRDLIYEAVFTLGEQSAPEEPVAEVSQYTDGVTVSDMTNRWAYHSADGGATWLNNAKPPIYLTLDKASVPRTDGLIPYTMHNTAKEDYITGSHYTVRKWDDEKGWQKIPEFEEMVFNDEGYYIPAGGTLKLNAQWIWNGQGIALPAGRYKLVKTVRDNDLELICEAVFVLT